MAEIAVADWERELSVWMTPFLAALGHPARCRWAPFYVRGLLGPGERKSVQPMAERLGLSGHDQLHNFIASPAWDGTALEAVLAAKADALVGGSDAVLVVDDTALPKKGTHSVGVAHQYAGALGKSANCQTLVSLTLARGEVPVPVALRLFLPKAWTDDTARCAEAGVPEDRRAPNAKTDMALDEIDRLRAAGVRFGCVLADAGYGISAAFRQGLDTRGLAWAVGVPRIQKAYPADVAMTWPRAATGRPRRTAVPDQDAAPAEDLLAGVEWRRISWREGTKGPLVASFAALRVRVADGPAARIRAKANQHLPGAEVWLVGERRASGERKYYLSNLPADAPLKKLAARIKARWVCEQGHQQMKEELGLDHFEGRAWHGLHHHALMVMVAYAFLQHLRLANIRERGKNLALPLRPTAPANAPRRPRRRRAPARARPSSAMPKVPSLDARPTACLKLPK